MSKLVGDGSCEPLKHTWEDGELSLRQCSSTVRLDNFCMRCVPTIVHGAEGSSREETGR